MFGLIIMRRKTFDELLERLEKKEKLAEKRLCLLMKEKEDNSSLREQLNTEISQRNKLREEVDKIINDYNNLRKEISEFKQSQK